MITSHKTEIRVLNSKLTETYDSALNNLKDEFSQLLEVLREHHLGTRSFYFKNRIYSFTPSDLPRPPISQLKKDFHSDVEDILTRMQDTTDELNHLKQKIYQLSYDDVIYIIKAITNTPLAMSEDYEPSELTEEFLSTYNKRLLKNSLII